MLLLLAAAAVVPVLPMSMTTSKNVRNYNTDMYKD
jgi:hypothetical protein